MKFIVYIFDVQPWLFVFHGFTPCFLPFSVLSQFTPDLFDHFVLHRTLPPTQFINSYLSQPPWQPCNWTKLQPLAIFDCIDFRAQPAASLRHVLVPCLMPLFICCGNTLLPLDLTAFLLGLPYSIHHAFHPKLFSSFCAPCSPNPVKLTLSHV